MPDVLVPCSASEFDFWVLRYWVWEGFDTSIAGYQSLLNSKWEILSEYFPEYCVPPESPLDEQGIFDRWQCLMYEGDMEGREGRRDYLPEVNPRLKPHQPSSVTLYVCGICIAEKKKTPVCLRKKPDVRDHMIVEHKSAPTKWKDGEGKQMISCEHRRATGEEIESKNQAANDRKEKRKMLYQAKKRGRSSEGQFDHEQMPPLSEASQGTELEETLVDRQLGYVASSTEGGGGVVAPPVLSLMVPLAASNSVEYGDHRNQGERVGDLEPAGQITSASARSPTEFMHVDRSDPTPPPRASQAHMQGETQMAGATATMSTSTAALVSRALSKIIDVSMMEKTLARGEVEPGMVGLGSTTDRGGAASHTNVLNSGADTVEMESFGSIIADREYAEYPGEGYTDLSDSESDISQYRNVNRGREGRGRSSRQDYRALDQAGRSGSSQQLAVPGNSGRRGYLGTQNCGYGASDPAFPGREVIFQWLKDQKGPWIAHALKDRARQEFRLTNSEDLRALDEEIEAAIFYGRSVAAHICTPGEPNLVDPKRLGDILKSM